MCSFRYLVVLPFLLSCSTKFNLFDWKEDTSPEPEKNIVKEFKVAPDVLNKFVEKKVEDPQPVAEENNQTSNIEKELNPKTSILKKNIPKQKKIVKKVKKSHEKLPKDYPERLIELNDVAKETWDMFSARIFQGEEISLKLSYKGVTMAYGIFVSVGKTQLGETTAFHFASRIKTAGFASYLYEVDDKLDTYVTADSFVPLKYSFVQRESKQDIDDLQLYDSEALKTYAFYYRKTSKKEKRKRMEEYIPKHFQDAFSLLYFLRGLPLQDEHRYKIPIVSKGETILLDVVIEGREKLDTEIGLQDAIRVRIEINEDGDTFKKGNLMLWFSDDQYRGMLKLEAETKIGFINGVITKWVKGKVWAKE